ncbi:MAG: SgcJ/EcaC family oxidoreductase [Alphaproteobacteria bacterium]|nr:SgcJ/EcaC family oxidoreductase [Alphaproteobacteria bacterium]
MKSLILAVAVLSVQLVATPAMAAETRTCADVSKKEIAALFDRWNESLQTKDAAKVAANYTTDAVLLPTVSNKPRTTTDGIKDYFEHFLQKSPKGRIDSSTIHIGCNEAFDVGTYTFALTDKDGKTQDVAARYSYIYELRDGKWLITHHHSSAMPEKVDAGHGEKH